MLELKRLFTTRIVAAPAALDAAVWPVDHLVLRTAVDEVLITPPIDNAAVDDPYAIVLADGGFFAGWLATEQALAFLERECEWELPQMRPAFVQGMVAGLPIKLWLETERVLLIVPAPFAADLEERAAQ